MDYGAAAVFFLLGLGVALLASSLTRRGRGGKGLEGLPMERGAVRMDRMVSRATGESRDAGSAAETPEGEEPAPESGRRASSRRSKGNRRRR